MDNKINYGHYTNSICKEAEIKKLWKFFWRLGKSPSGNSTRSIEVSSFNSADLLSCLLTSVAGYRSNTWKFHTIQIIKQPYIISFWVPMASALDMILFLNCKSICSLTTPSEYHFPCFIAGPPEDSRAQVETISSTPC